MTDIVERLRDKSCLRDKTIWRGMAHEAAEEIERLRAQAIAVAQNFNIQRNLCAEAERRADALGKRVGELEKNAD